MKQTFLKKSKLTVDREKYSLPSIFSFFQEKKDRLYMNQITNDDVTDYIYFLKDLGRPVVTINNYLRIVRKVFNRLYKLKKLEYNIAEGIEFLPMTAKEGARHVIFSLEDIYKLVNVKVNEKFWQFPTLSLFKVMLNTGIRLGEALHLSWKEIDFENKVIKIQAKPDCPTLLGMGWKPKFSKEYTVGMNEDVIQTLKKLPRCEKTEAKIKDDSKVYYFSFVFAKRTGKKHNCKKKCSNCETNVKLIRDRFNCAFYEIRYSRCDDVSKSWKSLLELAGIEGNKYHLEDTRRTFNTYAKSHADFSDALASFAIGNTPEVNIRHYTNKEVVDLSKIREVKEKINRLPFTEENIKKYIGEQAR